MLATKSWVQIPRNAQHVHLECGVMQNICQMHECETETTAAHRPTLTFLTTSLTISLWFYEVFASVKSSCFSVFSIGQTRPYWRNVGFQPPHMNQWVLREVVTSEELASSDNNKRDGQKRPSGTHLDREFPHDTRSNPSARAHRKEHIKITRRVCWKLASLPFNSRDFFVHA